ncbi:oligosaccharide flippase family protein [Altererythrobacter sp. GH1-8]|uniref:oligosaccharide flippase family protein n=1 Tax=Altererythrobacter sp. GH1-8 TaxID=3349333 RepID=UPI00374CA8EA
MSGALLSTLAFIGLTPILLSSLGIERYGVLLLVLGFLIYAGLAEFGLGSATSREIAAANQEDRPRIFGNALFLSIPFAGIGGGLFALLAIPAISSLLVDDAAVVDELARSGGALFALGAVSILASVPKGVIFGLSGFVSLNLVNLVGSVGAILAPALYAVLIGTDLPGLIAVTALAYVVTLVVAFLACLALRAIPDIRFESSVIKTLVSYGGWSTSSAMLHRLTNSLDRILLSGLSGPSAVTIFAIPQGALSRSQIVASALLSAAFPRLARSPNDAGLIETCYRGLFLLSPIFVVGVVFLHPVLEIWLGKEFADQAHLVAVFLTIATWLDLMGRVPYALLQARSELQQETRIAGLILVPNLLLLALSVKFFGVAGAAAIAIARAGAFVLLRSQATRIKPSLNWTVAWHSLAVVLASIASLYEMVGVGFVYAILMFTASFVLSFVLNISSALQFTRLVLPAIAKAQHRE